MAPQVIRAGLSLAALFPALATAAPPPRLH